ncbi:MAG: hypothetical protein GEU99_00860 [Luteitalea sp.]|nr:hypothetical protein [Luteitalea sp.]
MSLRVAFDLDGTLADMDSAVVRIARELFDPTVAATDSSNGNADQAGGTVVSLEALDLSAHQQATLWSYIEQRDNFWTSLAEIESGIVTRVAEAARARRWEVIFITTRPPTAGDTTQIQTQRWLEAHGFARPSVFVVTGSRGKVAEALTLDAVVDDHLEKAVDVAVESQAKAILVWNGDPGAVPASAARLGVKVVASIWDALAMLECLDDLRSEPGVLQSIKRMLTLRA